MVTAPVLHRTWGHGVPDESRLLQRQRGRFASGAASNFDAKAVEEFRAGCTRRDRFSRDRGLTLSVAFLLEVSQVNKTKRGLYVYKA